MAIQNDIIIGFSLYQGCTLVDFAGVTQVFSACDGFKTLWLANEETITTTEGVSVVPNYTFSKAPKVAILFVTGGGQEGVISTMQNQIYLNFIKKKGL